jgi:hypothetical protein
MPQAHCIKCNPCKPLTRLPALCEFYSGWLARLNAPEQAVPQTALHLFEDRPFSESAGCSHK